MLNLHQKTDPKLHEDFKGQGHYDKVKGQIKVTCHTEVVIHLMNAYCGVGAKSVAHLMKFYLLQWEVMKVKFLINSNMTFA